MRIVGRWPLAAIDPSKVYRFLVINATPREGHCSYQGAGSGRSSLFNISDWSVLPPRIASMMSGANNARRRVLLSAGTSASQGACP